MAERKPRPKQVVRRVSIPERLDQWVKGELKPEDLTDEEVHRMQLMDKNGHFSGRPSKVIPRDLAMAFRSEAQKRLMGWFQEMVPEAQKAYRDLLTARHLQPGDAAKLRAAEGVFERVIGKVPNATDMHVIIDDKPNFDKAATEIVYDLDEEEDDA